MKPKTDIERIEELAHYKKLADSMIEENARLKTELAARSMTPEEKDKVGIDDFTEMLADEVIKAAHHLAGAFMEFASTDDKEAEIEDGQYEEIKDTCEALARLVARKLGYSLKDMDGRSKHRIELPESERDDEEPAVDKRGMRQTRLM